MRKQAYCDAHYWRALVYHSTDIGRCKRRPQYQDDHIAGQKGGRAGGKVRRLRALIQAIGDQRQEAAVPEG